ncbi:unnamed protein product [Periconia digitata]|uniref:Uncharacterized protein n=1 Tax=Periconia digitata TaxID=1303443 RepID=A0A9W4XV97_9PLEO|nr:unnamed protein product [Periconia digitata]
MMQSSSFPVPHHTLPSLLLPARQHNPVFLHRTRPSSRTTVIGDYSLQKNKIIRVWSSDQHIKRRRKKIGYVQLPPLSTQGWNTMWKLHYSNYYTESSDSLSRTKYLLFSVFCFVYRTITRMYICALPSPSSDSTVKQSAETGRNYDCLREFGNGLI